MHRVGEVQRAAAELETVNSDDVIEPGGRERGCLGDAYSLKAGKAVEEVCGGVLGEWVNEPEVSGC